MPFTKPERSRRRSTDPRSQRNSRVHMPPLVPVHQHIHSLFNHSRKDSGVEVEDEIECNAQDDPLAFVDDRSIASSNPFAWQLESHLGKRARLIPDGGYCWSGEDTKHSIRRSERSYRIWENHFWGRGDRARHFPPIRVMTSIHESKFERIALCTYPQTYPRLYPIVHRKPRLRARNRQSLSFHDNWTGHLPHEQKPHPSVETNEMDWSGIFQQQKDLSVQFLCFDPKALVPQAVHNLRPQPVRPIDPPDRYYDLGEEALYVTKNGRSTPLKKENGHPVCDRWIAWAPSDPVVQVEPIFRGALRGACAEIVNWERTRPGRYLSWSSQVDFSNYRPGG